MKSVLIFLIFFVFSFGDEISNLRIACEKNGAACHALGVKMLNGEGVALDLTGAFANFQKGCTKKFAPSCFSVGILLNNGIGTKVDKFRAFEMFEKTCSGRVFIGCEELAKAYILGDAVRQNLKKSIQIYKQNCEKNRIYSSCETLSQMYLDGNLTTQNTQTGIKYIQIACNGGFSGSCAKLAQIYANGKYVASDLEKVYFYLDKDCTNGQSESCQNLGLLYIQGGKDEDIKHAKEYFGKSCDLKNAKGCESYKFINEHGL